MNDKQRSLSNRVLILFVGCLLYNGWKIKEQTNTKLGPLGYPNFRYLVIETAAIAVVFTIFLFIFRDPDKKR